MLQNLEKAQAVLRDSLSLNYQDRGTATALEEAVRWLYRAQDGSPDRGVSHSYAIGKGWARSYPETTGYIIPTLLNWSRITGDAEAARRATEMAVWEREVQLPNGAVMASVVGSDSPSPAVFNTGQVLFGWIAAYRHTGNQEFLDSAVRGARWLLESLGDRPIWDVHGSMGAPIVHTFNVRTAWAVLLLAKTIRDESFISPMLRVLDWALTQEEAQGWFAHNCLDDNEHPLLHTIAYTARGFLESGALLEREDYVAAAERTAVALAHVADRVAWMPGRYDRSFASAVRWSCLTGMAQTSIVWQRLDRLRGQSRFMETARRVNVQLRKGQDRGNKNPGIRGGIKGSRPVHGPYGKFRVLNWATKFFVDALLHEAHPEPMFAAESDAG